MADCEIAWTNLYGPNRLFHHRWMGMIRDSEKETCDRTHPTQKPVKLMTWCISMMPENLTILDPFAGSCTTARAAKDLGRKCVCIEREERYCEIGARRMSQEVFDLNLN
jgi:site-specific DNA-methyltransferase (adenine-specific)/modification methylase